MNYSEEDLIYAAGFLDGEGCFTAYGPNAKITVAAENTYKPVIVWLHNTFGGTLSNKNKVRKEHHRGTYRWTLVEKQAEEFCKIIVPYLKEKANQALLLMALQYTKGMKLVGNKLHPDVRAERERLMSLLKEAKHATYG